MVTSKFRIGKLILLTSFVTCLGTVTAYTTASAADQSVVSALRQQAKTHRKLQNLRDKLGTLQKVVTNDRHIAYRLDKKVRGYYELTDREKHTSILGDLASEEHAHRYNFMAVRTYYGSKQTLVAVRMYDLYDTYKPLSQAPAPTQLAVPDFDDEPITGYVPIQALHEVQPVVRQKKLANVPYYLNMFDGYNMATTYKMTVMRVWNAIPGSQPNVTSNDVSPYMYQQLYATREATNNQGRTYLYLRNQKGPIGWVRKSHQLSQGKYISPVDRLLHVQKYERLTRQIQPLATRHGYHLSQRVYNVYDRYGRLTRSLAMSYLFYPNLFIIKNNRVVTAKFYDHYYHVVKSVHNAKGLKNVTVNPKPGTLDYWDDNSRYAAFNDKNSDELYYLEDGLEDPESTYGTISVSHSGYAVMKSSGMASME